MKNWALGILALVALLGGSAWSACGPGDGGVPLVDISTSVDGGSRLIYTEGGVKDFVLWENSDSVAYRNESDLLFSTSLATGQSQQLSSGTVGFPLAHLREAQERFLVGDGTPWLFDAVGGGWYPYAPPAPVLSPLFWNQGVLYSVEQEAIDERTLQLTVYGYVPGGAPAAPVCAPITLHSGSLQGSLRLAEGSTYPNIYVYYQEDSNQGNRLIMSQVNIQTCAPQFTAPFYYTFYGPIQDVHMFDNLHAFAVKVDHPVFNLLWSHGSSCSYYDIGNLYPMALNESYPAVATWDPNQGLTVVYLNEHAKASVLKQMDLGEVSEHDLWLNRDGSKLYAAPKLEGANGRLLMELNLNSPE